MISSSESRCICPLPPTSPLHFAPFAPLQLPAGLDDDLEFRIIRPCWPCPTLPPFPLYTQLPRHQTNPSTLTSAAARWPGRRSRVSQVAPAGLPQRRQRQPGCTRCSNGHTRRGGATSCPRSWFGAGSQLGTRSGAAASSTLCALCSRGAAGSCGGGSSGGGRGRRSRGGSCQWRYLTGIRENHAGCCSCSLSTRLCSIIDVGRCNLLAISCITVRYYTLSFMYL